MLRKAKGFTLIELILVSAILAVLVTIALVALNPIETIQDTNDAKKRTELNQIKTALQLYFNENGDYPTVDEFDGCSAPCVPFVPTYFRTLPNWWAAQGEYGVSGTLDDYDAAADLDNPDPGDAETVTKCTIDATDYTNGVNDDFMVCPD
jgi:prepilin-type N-terminal cleavage/methylation domain-containing protein